MRKIRRNAKLETMEKILMDSSGISEMKDLLNQYLTKLLEDTGSDKTINKSLIARKFGVTEGMIRSRIKKIQGEP